MGHACRRWSVAARRGFSLSLQVARLALIPASSVAASLRLFFFPTRDSPSFERSPYSADDVVDTGKRPLRGRRCRRLPAALIDRRQKAADTGRTSVHFITRNEGDVWRRIRSNLRPVYTPARGDVLMKRQDFQQEIIERFFPFGASDLDEFVTLYSSMGICRAALTRMDRPGQRRRV